MKLLENKTALITGASRGIGRSHALLFAEEGANIIFTDLKENENSESLLAELRAKGVRADFLASNAADNAQAMDVAKWVADNYGRLDILVNNAGITKDTLMLRMTEEQWDAVMAVNLKGTFNFTKAAIRPMMKQRAGKIVNLASVVGRMGNVGQANYAASKAGVIALTKTTAKEFASRNIQANAVAPGYIITDMTANLPAAATEAFLKVIPCGHGGKPEDVANVVYFLCSSDSDYVTGQVINIDGGMLM